MIVTGLLGYIVAGIIGGVWVAASPSGERRLAWAAPQAQGYSAPAGTEIPEMANIFQPAAVLVNA